MGTLGMLRRTSLHFLDTEFYQEAATSELESRRFDTKTQRRVSS